MIWLLAGAESSAGKAQLTAIAHNKDDKKRTGLSSTDIILKQCCENFS
jgi:hypothetical protein